MTLSKLTQLSPDRAESLLMIALDEVVNLRRAIRGRLKRPVALCRFPKSIPYLSGD